MEIKILDLQKEDRKEWEKLYYGYAEYYQSPMNQEILDRLWSWIHDKENRFYGKIAKKETGEVLGIMHYREMPSPLKGKLVGFLDDIFIEPKFRGQSVVEAMFSALKQDAKSKGWQFVRWITREDNYRGRKAYDKLAEKTNWLTYQIDV